MQAALWLVVSAAASIMLGIVFLMIFKYQPHAATRATVISQVQCKRRQLVLHMFTQWQPHAPHLLDDVNSVAEMRSSRHAAARCGSNGSNTLRRDWIATRKETVAKEPMTV